MAKQSKKSKPMAQTPKAPLKNKIDKTPLKSRGNVVPPLNFVQGQKSANIAGKSIKVARA